MKAFAGFRIEFIGETTIVGVRRSLVNYHGSLGKLAVAVVISKHSHGSLERQSVAVNLCELVPCADPS